MRAQAGMQTESNAAHIIKSGGVEDIPRKEHYVEQVYDYILPLGSWVCVEILSYPLGYTSWLRDIP
jgi:hypothetical protein